ncbi:hypothetical protein PENSOL_c339G03478, partial [Penicillium solitum]
MFDIMPLKN